MEEVGDLAHSPPALRRGRSRRINQEPQTSSGTHTMQKATTQSVINDLEWSAPSSPVADESKTASETFTGGSFDPSLWQDIGSAFHTAFSLLGGDEGLSLEMPKSPASPITVEAAKSVRPSPQQVVDETETPDQSEAPDDMEISEPVAPEEEMDDDVVLISSREDDSDEMTLFLLKEQLASKSRQGSEAARGVKGGKAISKRKGRGRGRKKGKGRAKGRGRAMDINLGAEENEDNDEVTALPQQPLADGESAKETQCPIEIDTSPMHDADIRSPAHHSSSDCICIESDLEHITDSTSGQHEGAPVEQEKKDTANESDQGQFDLKCHNADVLCGSCQQKHSNRYTFHSCSEISRVSYIQNTNASLVSFTPIFVVF